MKDMTLREVCESTGASRRAIQGYESAGLVTPTGKNDRGHLIYSELMQDRIRKIKLYQDLGFSIKEIVEIIEAPPHILKPALESRLEGLQSEATNMQTKIKIIKELISEL